MIPTDNDGHKTGVASTSDVIRQAQLRADDRSAGISMFVIFAGSFCIGVALIGTTVLYVLCRPV